MTLAATSWQDVALALIAALPAIIAAVYAGRVHAKVKTPSGTTIGKQVENALHTALANNYRLRSISGEGAVPSPEAVKAENDRATAATGDK